MSERQGGKLNSQVIDAKFFDSLGYSTVWEDERVIERGLRPRAKDRVLSITSGGCFTLNFLLHDVAEVLSVDFNRNQNDLLAVKMAAAQQLSHDELWSFLGLDACGNRQELYRSLHNSLEESIRQRVERQPGWIEQGISLVGRQDRYFHLVGNLIRMLQGETRVRKLLSGQDVERQKRFYLDSWNTKRWRLLCALVFNRVVLHKAFDKEHFTHSQEKKPANRLRLEVERALTNAPGSDNFYLHYLFRKTYPSKENCPAWLRASSHRQIKERLPRVRLYTGQLEHLLFSLDSDSVDLFNLSNLFDWVSRENFVRLMQEVIRVAAPGARLCYWTNAINTLRQLSWVQRPELCEDELLGRELSLASRTPGYSGCVIATVHKGQG